MKAGVGSVRLRLLGIVMQSAGLPEKLSVARLQLDLRDDGSLDDIRHRISEAGKVPATELGKFYTSRVLHGCDPTGTAAQMRTQLRVTHEACRSVAERPLGAVISADFLYDPLASDLVISGEMQKRFQEIIEEQKGRPGGELRSRIRVLVFLINKTTPCRPARSGCCHPAASTSTPACSGWTRRKAPAPG